MLWLIGYYTSLESFAVDTGKFETLGGNNEVKAL